MVRQALKKPSVKVVQLFSFFFAGGCGGVECVLLFLRVQEKVALECGSGCKSKVTMRADGDSRASVRLKGQPVLSSYYFWMPPVCGARTRAHTKPSALHPGVKSTLSCLSSCHKNTISHKSTVADSKQAGVLL